MSSQKLSAAIGRIAVIGTGLIGGSIALGLRRAGITVVGWDVAPPSRERAVQFEAVSHMAESLPEAVDGAEIAVIAVPVRDTASTVIASLDAGSGVVTDVASVKAPVIAAVATARPHDAARFVGGHPMRGAEVEGLEGARADLFLGAPWVVSATSTTSNEAVSRVRQLAQLLGAHVVELDAVRQDGLTAIVSHLPQLSAWALMGLVADDPDRDVLVDLAAGGFRDMTRIAASPVGMWTDICRANREPILRALDSYTARLTALRALVEADDSEELARLMTEARTARIALADQT